MNLSYKKRLASYKNWKRGNATTLSLFDIDRGYQNLIRSVEMDYTLTVNDVADILGFSVEHVQNHVLQHLDTCDAREFADGGEIDLRGMLCNNRLKVIVSKSSLEEYISSNLAVSARKTVTTFERDSVEIDKIKEILGPGAKIQKMLDDAGKHLNEKFNYKKLEEEERIRKEKIKKRLIENDANVEEFLQGKDDNLVDVLDYSDIDDENVSVFDTLVNDMYSVKELKKRWGMRHTMQVYRELDKTSYVAVQIGNADYIEGREERGVKGDRNIRYIINHEDLKIEKGVYRIQLNHAVYSKLESVAGVMAIETEDAIMMQVLDFAKENKEKYKKKKKESAE